MPVMPNLAGLCRLDPSIESEEKMAAIQGMEPTDRWEAWPALPLSEWAETYATLHMWSQVVGKVRLALSPRVNHWWEVPLYVSGRGLTTSPIPYEKGIFEVQFDFIHHKIEIETNDGAIRSLPLVPRSVADFY